MKSKKLLLSGYKITSDENYINNLFPIPHELNIQLADLHYLAQKGKESSIKKFVRLIEKYPQVPTLKNYLSVTYQNMGNRKKANEVNHWIIAEHPNYLYGKINLAAEYWQNQEFEKIPEVLGEKLDLKALFPERDTFHVDEVIAFFSITVIYFAELGEIEEAELRMEIMKEVYPESPKIEIIEGILFKAKIKAASKRMVENQENNIYIDIEPTKSGNKTEMPQFNHSEIEQLYTNGSGISENIIVEILNLPRKTLIADLEKILTDSVERYNYFLNYDGLIEENSSFAIHSLIILGELKASESLNSVLNFLKQDEGFLDFYLGDTLTEIIWQILYNIENKNLDIYLKFIQEPGIYSFCKSAVTELIAQTVLHNPDRKTEAIGWFKKVIIFFLNSKIEDNVIDSIFLGSLVNNILDIKANELLPDIEKLYQKNIVDLFACGDFDDVQKLFREESLFTNKNEILSITETYNKINSWSENQKNPFNDNDEINDDYEYIQNSIEKKEPKVGRNEPCPCGSGKKYKKCCLNKN
ncbi:MAG: hypothetical protein A2W98_14750 [Bacteroidetes bacterium GWF2_33_38]|nr:MAG: hypothetical protein A2W98_14750 [Bacteroidetes bacterium GWF2_33_38]